MKELAEYLKATGSNSFSSLALLKGMAHSAVLSSPRPPMIVPGRKKFDVEISGSRVTLTDVRNVYKRALHRCQELQERLLLGATLPKLRPHDDLSDTRSGKGMLSDPDEGIHEYIETTVLSKVLSDANLS
jgi:hypothetical protein